MEINERLQLQRENLVNLLRSGAFQFIDEKTPWFPYTSGEIGPYYVQSIAVEKDGAAYVKAVDSLVNLIKTGFPDCDLISGGETRDWDFSNPVAYALGKPHLKLYKNGKMLGADPAGKRVLHVADLNNEGSSVRDYWLPAVRKSGGDFAGVVFFVDRLEDGARVMDSLGLQHDSVVPLNEQAWAIVRDSGYISEAVYGELVKRIADKRAWALDRLKTHKSYFMDFQKQEANRDKASKIIKTYPEIAEQ